MDLNNIRIINAGGEGVEIDHTAGATSGMDVTFNNLDINASTGPGMDVASVNNGNAFNLRILDSTIDRRVTMSHTSAGNFGLLVDNSQITTTGNDVAFTLAFSGAAQDGDVTIRNGSQFTAGNASAFAYTSGGANTDVEFSVTDSAFNNASAAEFTASSSLTRALNWT